LTGKHPKVRVSVTLFLRIERGELTFKKNLMKLRVFTDLQNEGDKFYCHVGQVDQEMMIMFTPILPSGIDQSVRSMSSDFLQMQ
jgi:hypothetical protein